MQTTADTVNRKCYIGYESRISLTGGGISHAFGYPLANKCKSLGSRRQGSAFDHQEG